MNPDSGFDAAAAIQMGMMRASGMTPSAPWAAARDLSRAVARAATGRGDDLDVMNFKF